MRSVSLVWLAFAFVLSAVGVGQASEITEAVARQRTFDYVRAQLQLGRDHFLRATRREDLEDDLFAAQMKVSGQIHKAAFLFEVTETGYEIRSPDEAVFHSAVDGFGRWYVAVATLSGDVYGLGGFDNAEKDFNRLASDAKVFLASDEGTRNWAVFYLTVVAEKSLGVFLVRPKDLQRQIEDIGEGYSSSRKQPFAPRRWLQDLEKSGVDPHIGMQVTREDGGSRVLIDSVSTSSDRTPILQRIQFGVSSRGVISGQSVSRLFPRSPVAGR
jgi:hypothetical protein